LHCAPTLTKGLVKSAANWKSNSLALALKAAVLREIFGPDWAAALR
jgi:hypothetical protein